MSLRAADPKLGERVGAVVLALLILAIAYVLFLRDHLFLGPKVTVRVYFTHVGALHEGASVIVAGEEVGKVRAIQLLPADAVTPDDPMPPGIGGAVAILAIDADLADRVPVNGDFFVSSKGIFSDRYLEIGPPGDGSEPGRPVHSIDKVRGIDPPSMDRVMQNTWNDLNVARAFLAEIQPEADALFAALDELRGTLASVEPATGAIAELRGRIDDAVTEARTTWLGLTAAGARPEDLAALGDRARAALDAGGKAIASLRTRIARLQEGFDRVRGQIDGARPGLEHDVRTALTAIDHALAGLDDVRAKAEDLMAMIARGEGTIGRLANDPEFPEDAKELQRILKRQPWRIVGHPQDQAQ